MIASLGVASAQWHSLFVVKLVVGVEAGTINEAVAHIYGM